MQKLPLNLLLITLSVIGLFFVLIVALFWRGWNRRKKTEHQLRELQSQLDASLSLGGYLLEAQDESAAILAAMRSGQDLLKAEGCAFVPLDEWAQTLPVLKHGAAAFLQDDSWRARLSEPATRHACRNCETRQAGSTCALLQPPANAEHVYCVALRCGGREIGVVNYFFAHPPQITESQQAFLREIVRLTDLSLDALRLHAHELESLKRGQKPLLARNELSTENQDVLEQLEYQAVLDERTRLAREIHDGLAQTLAFLKMEAARLQTYVTRDETTAVAAALQACYRTLSDAYLDARQAIDNLRRVPDESLPEWLGLTASDFESLTNLPVDISQIALTHTFANTIKAQLVRIVQEALNNIRKHAQAESVSIAAFERGREVVLEIKDDGRGFSPEDVKPASQYGLRSMRERAELIQADFQVISAPGMGTTIRLQIPIREKANL